MGQIIRLSGSSRYGYKGWQPAEIVRNREQSIQSGEPEWLWVTEAGCEPMDDSESGEVYWAVCRPASADEAAIAITEREQMIRRTKAQRELELIAQESWDYIRGSHQPEGEVICVQPPETRAALENHGLTDWFVLDQEWIWKIRAYCQEVGRNSQSNAEFRGLVTHAQRQPATPDVATRIRELARIAHEPGSGIHTDGQAG